MSVLYTNNAKTTLSASLNNSATSLSVASSSGFPSLSGSHYFYATLDDNTNLEVVKVTAVSGTTWTVVRGQDNTSATAFSSGDTIELRLNAALLTDVVNDALASSFTRQDFTGNGSTTAFTLNKTPGSESDLIVFIEGVFQNQADYTLSGTTLTFDEAPASSRKIVVYHVSASVSGDSLALNTFSGDGSTTAFTMSVDPLYENNTMVFIDGVYQNKSTYSTSGTTLTFDAAPANGTSIDVTTHTQQTINVPVDGSVSTAKITADAVTGAKIADDAINSEHYTDGSIDTAHIANLQVTTGKLAADAVTAAKLADDSVVTANITDDAVTTAKIADDQITLAKLAGLARGKIIYGDASGNPAALTVGSAGTVLTSDGTDISWAEEVAVNYLPLAGGTMTGNIVMGDDTSIGIADDAERIEFDGAGDISLLGANVGVGTTSPLGKLSVGDGSINDAGLPVQISTGADGTQAWYAVNRNGGYGALFGYSVSSTYKGLALRNVVSAGTSNADGISFLTNNTSMRMHITGDGKVGIGTDSPATKLQLLHAGQCKITLGYSTTQYAQLGRDTSGNYELACYENGANLKFGTSQSNNATTERMRIGPTGKTSWSANGVGNVATQDRDFTFYTEGSTNGVAINSAANRIIFMGGAGSSGTGSDKGYLQLEAEGTAKVVFNSGGASYLTSGSSDGTLGIGVDDPKAHIHTHIASSGGTYHQFTNSSTGDSSNEGWKIGIHDDENFIIWGQQSTESFRVYNNGAYRFTIDHNGAVGIPAAAKFYLDGISDTYMSEYSANEVEIATGGARRFALSGGNAYFSGSVNANHNFSDERLKENIVVIPNALEKVSSLRGITFTRKADGSVGTGLIAQELEKVLPEAVYESKTIESLDDPDAEEYKGIRYETTVGLLVEAIKELEARIKTLEDA